VTVTFLKLLTRKEKQGYKKDMKKRLIIITSFSLLVIITAVIIYCNLKKNNNEFFLYKEWLNKELASKDETMIEEIYPLLLGIPTIDQLLNNYNFDNEKEQYRKRELGLGYSRTNFRRRGAYTTIYASILTDKNNNSIESVISIGGEKDIIKILDKKFKLSKIKKSNIDYWTKNTYIDFRYRDKNLYKIFENDYAQYFQINNRIHIPHKIKTEYEILFNAGMYRYRGDLYGNNQEREALKKIIEMNDKKILLAILSSHSPGGRMYAIEGLFWNRISDILNENEYTDIFNKIIALNIDVFITYGDVIANKWIKSIEDIYKIINNDID
jgi:hypothetical protein